MLVRSVSVAPAARQSRAIAWRAARIAAGGGAFAAVFLQDVAHCIGIEEQVSAAVSDAAAALASASGAVAGKVEAAAAAAGDDDGAFDALDALFRKALAMVPTDGGGVIGYGAIVGYCSAVALREVGHVAAVALGGVFLVVQGAATLGWVDINTNKLSSDVTRLLDADGDGKLTKADLQLWYDKAKALVPSTAGFGAGFAFGLFF